MDTTMLLLILCAAGDLLLLVVLWRVLGTAGSGAAATAKLDALRDAAERGLQTTKTDLSATMTGTVAAMNQGVQTAVKNMGDMMDKNQTAAQTAQIARLDQIDKNILKQQNAMNQAMVDQLALMENRMKHLEASNEAKLNAMRETLAQNMTEMRADNTKKLEEIRHTVDEKLQDTLEKRIAESFKTVNEQLEQVYKGLGEMQTLASDVGGLKQVLSGVKTRGILGEIQLGAILEEILAPEQYETNVATIPGSTQRVEFAVRLPGTDGNTVYLPIDSKFPGDTYARLQEASASGDADAVAAAVKDLENVIKAEAKDIFTKYVEPPYTTNFGIMFLPFEGLYAEVVNHGLLEILQRDYHVNVAGPSTMAALLSSLQMGFKTLAIQKRSNEVWQILGAVKTEFGKFQDGLMNMQRHLDITGRDLNALITTRTNAINRKLSAVQELDAAASAEVLALPGEDGAPADAAPPAPDAE